MLLTNNYIMENHSDLNMFATMFFGVLDPMTGGLVYINGGHNPPYIMGADGALKAVLKPTGMAVGMMAQTDFRTGDAQLEPGDTLVMYTDGVPDARNPAGGQYTDKRLRELLATPATSAAGLLEVRVGGPSVKPHRQRPLAQCVLCDPHVVCPVSLQ